MNDAATLFFERPGAYEHFERRLHLKLTHARIKTVFWCIFRHCAQPITCFENRNHRERNGVRYSGGVAIMIGPQMKTMLAAAVCAGLLAAQQQDQPLLLKATTRLVLLSVIAQGHDGHPDTTLRKEDFRVRVNGKPQTIGTFSMETAGALASAVNAPAQ